MKLRHTFALVLFACLPSMTTAAHREPVQAQRPNQRELARQEFIAARQAFTQVLVSVMTTEQLAARARELSVKARSQQTQERLNQVRKRLRNVEAEGRANSGEVQRLRKRVSTLKEEHASLKNLLENTVQQQDDTIVTKVIAGQFQNDLDEETEYLADVLETPELTNRAAQLRQMAKLGRFAGGLEVLQDKPSQTQAAPPLIDEAPPAILPTGESVDRKTDIE